MSLIETVSHDGHLAHDHAPDPPPLARAVNE